LRDNLQNTFLNQSSGGQIFSMTFSEVIVGIVFNYWSYIYIRIYLIIIDAIDCDKSIRCCLYRQYVNHYSAMKTRLIGRPSRLSSRDRKWNEKIKENFTENFDMINLMMKKTK